MHLKLTCGFKVIYEGRGDGIQGAHFSGMNGGTMGVALIGDFTLETPSSSAINSLQYLIAWEATDKNIDVNTMSFHSSSGLTLNNVSGHLDGTNTVCPGTDLYSLLPSIRTNVSNFPCYNGGNSNLPDLVIENMWTVPANPEVGENIDLYVEIKNVGDQTANSISLDYEIDGNIIGSDTHSSLAPNENKTEFYNNYVFSNANNYAYCVYIDAVTNEQNTANNSFCINVDVGGSTGGSEDITVTNATVTPTTVNAGEDIDVSANQNYSGTQLDEDLPSFNLDYYLSTDCTLSSDDILLGGDSSGLGSDDPTNEENETLTIPSTTNSGTYFIIFAADNENELNESNENNNTACVQIIIYNTGGSEDITVTNATVTPTTVNAGEDIEVSANQNYSGTQLDEDLPSFNLDYYLSTDCTLSSDDILLGGDSSGLGSDDPTNEENETLTIPSTTNSDTYFIIFAADNENELNESNENNNTACVQITIEDVLTIIDYELQKQIKVYPNPTSSWINIKTNNNLTLNRLVIYDMSGNQIKEIDGSNLNKINISELASGLYLLEVVNSLNKKAVLKIIKK